MLELFSTRTVLELQRYCLEFVLNYIGLALAWYLAGTAPYSPWIGVVLLVEPCRHRHGTLLIMCSHWVAVVPHRYSPGIALYRRVVGIAL